MQPLFSYIKRTSRAIQYIFDVTNEGFHGTRGVAIEVAQKERRNFPWCISKTFAKPSNTSPQVMASESAPSVCNKYDWQARESSTVTWLKCSTLAGGIGQDYALLVLTKAASCVSYPPFHVKPLCMIGLCCSCTAPLLLSLNDM